MVEVNSSQIFMVLFMSLLIRRNCISVSSVYAVKEIMHSTRVAQFKGFFLLECGDLWEGILFERKAFVCGVSDLCVKIS